MQRVLPILLIAACVAISCSQAGAAEPKSDGKFILKVAPFKNSDYIGVRIDANTGKGWYVKSGNWQPITDTESLPTAHYDLQLVSSGHPDQANWNAFRFNLDTGRTWRLVSGKWQVMQTLTDE